MKNLMMLLLVMTVSVFATQLQAQTQCTAAQKEACKKICADKTACTPEQIAACKKICATKKGTATAAVKVNQSPEKANANTTTNNGNASLAKLTGLVEIEKKTDQKKASCNKPCTGKKKE